MAQIKNSKKSEGLCHKIHNAVSPFRSRTRHISHQPQGSISVTSDKKPPPQTEPVHVLIPVEFNHFPSQNTNKLVTLSPVVQSAEKENITDKAVQELGDRDILIVRSRKFAKSDPVATPEKVPNVVPTDGSVPERKFSEYIIKVKDSWSTKTAENVGGGVEKSLSFK